MDTIKSFMLYSHYQPNKTLKLKQISDAPLGNMVFETNLSDHWVESERIPCDVTETYEAYGYMRWCGDGNNI